MRRTCKLLMAIFLGVNLIFAGGCFFTSSQGSGDDNIEASDFTLDPAKEYKIEFMMWGAKDEVDNYTALIDKFMDENENVTVSITTQDSTQYMSTLTGRLSGTMPDLFYLPEYEFVPGWIRDGFFPSATGLRKRNIPPFGQRRWIGTRITAPKRRWVFRRARISIACPKTSGRGR